MFYATKKVNQAKALSLVNEELRLRQDVYTWDALAWAQFAAGNFTEAETSINKALAEKTQDARFFLHAAVINSHLRNQKIADKFFERATTNQHMLLPSERNILQREAVNLTHNKKSQG